MKREKLRVQELSMAHGGVEVLNSVSFSVTEGEFFSILGPSGCGKTTLLRILAGLLAPTGGSIQKDGVDITGLPPAQRGMGIVFQNYALFEGMTVLDNIEYALRIRRENRSPAARQRIRGEVLALMERLSLIDHAGKRPAALSGGQQQRVAFARTLALRPDILLFDEPMSALDAVTRTSLQQELKGLQKDLGHTIIYVTHNQEEAFSMSDRIMVMKKAEVAQTGTLREILRQPASSYVEEFVAENLFSRARALNSYLGTP